MGKQGFAAPNAQAMPLLLAFPPAPPRLTRVIWRGLVLGSALLRVSAVRPTCGVTNRLLPGKVHMKRGFCGREDLTPRKACPAAGCRAPSCPAKSNGGRRERLAPAQPSLFWGLLQCANRSGPLGDKPEELGVLQRSTANWFPATFPPMQDSICCLMSTSVPRGVEKPILLFLQLLPPPPAPPYGALRSQETLQRSRPSPSNCFFQVPPL